MALTILCPKCGRKGQAPPSAMGRIVMCPGCGHQTRLQPGMESPGAGSPPPLAAAEPRVRPARKAPAAVPGWIYATIAGGGVALLALVALVVVLLSRGGSSSPPAVAVEAARPAEAPKERLASTAPAQGAQAPSKEPAPRSEVAETRGDEAAPGAKKGDAKPAPEDAPGAPGERALSTSEIVERCDPSIALIRGRMWLGSGFLVGPGIVATNSHVIAGEFINNLEVRFPAAPDGQKGPFTARLLYEDGARDLALLAVKSTLPALELASRLHCRKGEDITVIGSPGVGDSGLVMENAVTRGVMSIPTKLNGQDFYQLSIAINPGNSGGPVFDARGRVIGVVKSRANRQEGIAFCIPVEDLNAALERQRGQAPLALDETQARHQILLTYVLLAEAGVVQAVALETMFANAADRAVIRQGLKIIDRNLFFGVQDEARKVSADTAFCDAPVRKGIVQLADSYADLRTTTDEILAASPADSARFRPRVAELKKIHLQLTTQLMALLKIEIPEDNLAWLKEGTVKDPKAGLAILNDPGSSTGPRLGLRDRFGAAPGFTPRTGPRTIAPPRRSPLMGPRRPGRLGR